MICKKCNAKVPDDSDYCPERGQKIESKPTPAYSSPLVKGGRLDGNDSKDANGSVKDERSEQKQTAPEIRFSSSFNRDGNISEKEANNESVEAVSSAEMLADDFSKYPSNVKTEKNKVINEDDSTRHSIESHVYSGDSYSIPSAVVLNLPATDWKNSFFDGGLLGLIGVNLTVLFVSLITIGFAWPALCCFRLRWMYKHTCIGGYRLKFNGKGIQLFGKCLIWILLTIVTVGIYSFWLPIKYRKWEISHVVIDSMIPVKPH